MYCIYYSMYWLENETWVDSMQIGRALLSVATVPSKLQMKHTYLFDRENGREAERKITNPLVQLWNKAEILYRCIASLCEWENILSQLHRATNALIAKTSFKKIIWRNEYTKNERRINLRKIRVKPKRIYC